MSRRKKRLAKVLENPRHVRYQELETILLGLGFEKRQDSTSHVIFSRDQYTITVPKPHGSPFVLPVYIVKVFIPTLEAMGLMEDE